MSFISIEFGVLFLCFFPLYWLVQRMAWSSGALATTIFGCLFFATDSWATRTLTLTAVECILAGLALRFLTTRRFRRRQLLRLAETSADLFRMINRIRRLSGIWWQNLLLLVASYALVLSFSADFALILAAYTLALYLLCQAMLRFVWPRFWLTLAVVGAVVNLGVFKYFDFFRDALLNIGIDLPALELVLPIGISFYTFHSISLLVSLYRREVRMSNPLDFALYLAFFPSLMAGPINRARDFLPQIAATRPREPLQLPRALTLIVLAVIKVLWLNSALGLYWVDPVFANPGQFNSLELLLAVYAYAAQLYLNFSGYTDIVTAIALLLGFRLPVNFNLPYLAANLREFWQRWHISLSSWIRDYVYIPLGGNRLGFVRTQCNLMAAMLVSGLWHGANYNFIVWGAIHGVGVVLLNIGDRLFGPHRLSRRAHWLATFITFQYVCFAWIFFRCPTLETSLDYLQALSDNLFSVPLTLNAPLYLVFMLAVYITYPWLAQLPGAYQRLLERLHWSLAPLLLAATLWLVINLAPPGIPGFIYANF